MTARRAPAAAATPAAPSAAGSGDGPGNSAQRPLVVADLAAFRNWLDVHENTADRTWILMAKKGAALSDTPPPTSLRHEELIPELLCSGWIDGQTKSVDAVSWTMSISPRRARSVWSARNVGIVAELLAAGRMRERGLREVRAAQQDGRWDSAYAGPATIEIPEMLKAALAAEPELAAAFDALDSRNRYAHLHRIVTKRTDRGRAAGVAAALEALRTGAHPHPPGRRTSPPARSESGGSP